jgi:hypothetical protein
MDELLVLEKYFRRSTIARFSKTKNPIWGFFIDLIRKGRSSNNQRYNHFLKQIESIYVASRDQTGTPRFKR